MWTRDGNGNYVYIGNGFASTSPTASTRSLMTAWSPYPGLR
jgi:hypothetical protein